MLENYINLFVSLGYGISLLLSIREYFIIKAFKENRKFKYFLVEGMTKMPKLYDSDFIEILPCTFYTTIIKKYNYENEKLKRLYIVKAIYELLFWFFFVFFFLF